MDDFQRKTFDAVGEKPTAYRIRASIDLDEGVSCQLITLSDTKATLELAQPLSLPTEFKIAIQGESKKRYCAIAWRWHRRVGVLFV